MRAVSLLKIIIDKIRFFGILYLFFLVGTAYMIVNYSRNDGAILVNKSWTEFQDVLFIYSTYLGEGYLVALIIFSVGLFISVRKGVIILTSFVFTAVITQFLKHIVFPEAMRPFIELWNEFKYGGLHMALGEEFMKKGNSFPSGHTTSAFSIFIILTLISKKPVFGFLFALLAILASYSRVYLSQHFFEDVFLGSIIGVFGTILIYFIFEYKSWLKEYNYSLIKFDKNAKKVI